MGLSRTRDSCTPLGQLVELLVLETRGPGSNPGGGTVHWGVVQWQHAWLLTRR